jgi:hypothetical protein
VYLLNPDYEIILYLSILLHNTTQGSEVVTPYTKQYNAGTITTTKLRTPQVPTIFFTSPDDG